MGKAATFIALGVVLVLAVPKAHADQPTANPNLYGYLCGTEPAADQPQCRRCVDEASAGKPVLTLEAQREPAFTAAVSNCERRMKSEKAERQDLINKFNAWQPRGYEGTVGDGIEALTDAELDALPATEMAVIHQINVITVDLEGKEDLPSADRLAAVLAEMRGFIAKERACRVDGKCMATRAARKAAEEFFTSVVAPMCEADKSREAAEAGIAKERANPSGVVDLNVLHSLGAEIQDAKDQIKSLAAAYAKFRHHAWTGWRSECQ